MTWTPQCGCAPCARTATTDRPAPAPARRGGESIHPVLGTPDRACPETSQRRIVLPGIERAAGVTNQPVFGAQTVLSRTCGGTPCDRSAPPPSCAPVRCSRSEERRGGRERV